MATIHKLVTAPPRALRGRHRHLHSLVAALTLLTGATQGLAQAGWASYDILETNQTLYVQPASADPVTNRRVVWIASPVSIGDGALKWADETAAGPEHAELHCRRWAFDGVRDSALVFTTTRLDTVLNASDPAERPTVSKLAGAAHGSKAWAQLLVTSACTRHGSEGPGSPWHDPRARTLYVPLDPGGNGTTVLLRPWGDGFLALRFGFATNTLSIRQL